MTTYKKDPHAVYDEAAQVWNPSKVEFFRAIDTEIVMGERKGYTFVNDVDGRKLIDMHLNGGVFNLGHCNDEIADTLIHNVGKYDAGNHYFPSAVKNALCERLLSVSPDYMKYVAFASGGGESVDAAIKFSRFTTGRSRVITVTGAFHGATGLAVEAGSETMSGFFNMEPDQEEFTKISYNDLEALEKILKLDDTACVLVESIPAAPGFHLPDEEYLKGVTKLAHKYGALYVADEVQTGLMRSGDMWCSVGYGAEPDMIVTAKGLSGGYYPTSAVIMNDAASQWLSADGFAHQSSFHASEIGCLVSDKAVEITSRESTRENVNMLSNLFGDGLEEIRSRHSDFFDGVNHRGVIFGLRTTHPDGGTALMTSLLRRGMWAMRANFDTTSLQLKPGLLMDRSLAEHSLEIIDNAMGDAEKLVSSSEFSTPDLASLG